MLARRLRADCDGAAMVEFAVVLPLLLLLIGGIVDFSLAFWQMNMATKAVERGARIAAVSNPVATGFEDIDTLTGGQAGDTIPAGFTFQIRCDNAGCTCVSGSCGGVGYDAAALDTIVYGRGHGSTCAVAEGPYALGMCNFYLFGGLAPENVVVEYRAAPGVGFRGRPCGPVATVTVSLRNMTFGWFFLGVVLNSASLAFPPMRTTITSEDLSFGPGPNPDCP